MEMGGLLKVLPGHLLSSWYKIFNQTP